MYLDHVESLRARNWDDVVQYLVVDLPPVFGPAKPSLSSETEVCAWRVQTGGDHEALSHTPYVCISGLYCF